MLRAFGDLDLIAGFPDQVGDIDHRQRIGAVHFQKVARLQRLQRLSRLQCRQRTFEAGEVEFCRGHASNMAKGAHVVNGQRRDRLLAVFNPSKTTVCHRLAGPLRIYDGNCTDVVGRIRAGGVGA